MPDFGEGYFVQTKGERYSVKGICLRCDEQIFAGAWVFAMGDYLMHFDCAERLVRGADQPDAFREGFFVLPQRRSGRAA